MSAWLGEVARMMPPLRGSFLLEEEYACLMVFVEKPAAGIKVLLYPVDVGCVVQGGDECAWLLFG